MPDARAALAFVREHGVVLASARGPVPSVAEFVAGRPIRGSWWGDPQGEAIFLALQAIADAPDVLQCKLVGGKVTFVHRRLWPALVRAAGHFTRAQLARVREEHTTSGKHVTRTTPFPRWVPAGVRQQARRLGAAQAVQALGPWAGATRP